MMSAVVLGIGNLLLQDEGVGALAAQELVRRFYTPDGLEIIDGGTAGIELMGYIANRDLLIIIDAVKSGQEPGTIVRIEGEEVPATFRQRLSPHQLGLSDLLATCILTGETPERMVLFGVEPAGMETGIGLTEKVAASFDRLLEMVRLELQRSGHDLPARPAEAIPDPTIWATG